MGNPIFKYEKSELLVCIYEISRELVCKYIWNIFGIGLTNVTGVRHLSIQKSHTWDFWMLKMSDFGNHSEANTIPSSDEICSYSQSN